MAEFAYLNGGNSEVQDKQAEAYLYASSGTVGIAKTGVIEGLVVRQTSTASGSVLIDAGACLNQASLGQGVDRLINPSQKTLDIFTANPVGGLPRNDIVAFDSITTAILALIGTPNATPSDPTVPATSVALARLRHAASATTIPTAKIDPLIVPTTLRGISTTGANMGTPTSTVSDGTPASNSTSVRDAVFGNYVFTALAGRRYEIRVGGMGARSTTTNEGILTIHNGGASTPTTASAIVASGRALMTTSRAVSIPVTGSFVPGAGVQTLSLFTACYGAGTVTPSRAGYAVMRELYVVDIGPA